MIKVEDEEEDVLIKVYFLFNSINGQQQGQMHKADEEGGKWRVYSVSYTERILESPSAKMQRMTTTLTLTSCR